MPTTGRRFRNFNVSASTGLTQNFGRETLGKDVGLSVGATHLSQYGFNARFNNGFWAFDDRLTRGGPPARAPGGWSASLNFNTPPQAALQPRLGFNYSEDDAGGWRRSMNTSVTLRFRGVSELILGGGFSRSRSPAQCVTTITDSRATATYGRRYVFAPSEAFASWLSSLSDAFLAERVENYDKSGSRSRFEMLLAPKEHEMHHRGQLMLMERLVGIVPHLTRERMARAAAVAR